MAKAIIINATANDNEIVVEYASGSIRKYPLDKVPQTVKDFMGLSKTEERDLPVIAERSEVALVRASDPVMSGTSSTRGMAQAIKEAVRVTAPVVDDALLTAVVFTEKALEAAIPVIAKLVGLIAKGARAVLPIIWMVFWDALDAMVFWVPELLHRFGFVLAWRIWPEIAHSIRGARRMAINFKNGLVAQWIWAEELKAELRCA